MIGALALVMLSFQGSNLNTVIPKWTGQNGYEDYVRAAMILDRPENRAIETFVRSMESPGNSEKTPQRPSSMPDDATLLQVYQIEVQQLEPALDLIRQGNRKAVTYPDKPYTQATLFPELALLKTSGRLFSRLAYVEFAAGRHKAATQAILDGLQLSKKVQVAGLISYLVGRAIEDIMVEAVDRRLGDLGIEDARRISEWVSGLPDPRVAVRAAAIKDRDSYRTTFEDYCADPRPYLPDDVPAATLQKIRDVLQRATPEWKEQAYASTLKQLEAPWAAMAERASQPEPEWLKPLDYGGFRPPTPPTQPADAQIAIVPLLTVLATLSGEPGQDLPLGFVRGFVRERLLKIHCDVLQAQWKAGMLPRSLAQVYGSEPLDPATGDKYTFTPLEGGKFKVVCSDPKIGEISLRTIRRLP